MDLDTESKKPVRKTRTDMHSKFIIQSSTCAHYHHHQTRRRAWACEEHTRLQSELKPKINSWIASWF